MTARKDVLPILTLVLLSALPFIHIMALPIFEDEGSQLRWIWRIIEAGEWAHPLFDGKPLEAWPMVPLVQLGMPPLLAMRGLHVLAGMGATVLIYRLALELNGRAGAFVAAALFAICPFEVYLQRLALSDILLSTAGLWVLLRSIRFLESPSAGNAAALSGTLLLAAICKLPVGFIFLLVMPLALALMPAQTRLTLLRRPVVPRLLAAHAPAFLLALAILAAAAFRLQRGQPPGFGIQDLLGIGAGSYTDIAAVIGVARPNLMTELSAQLSWPVAILGVIGLAGAALGDWRHRWLAFAGAVPMLCIGLGAHFWYSRYLLFTLPPLIVVSVHGWQALTLRAARFRRPIECGLIAICVGFMGRQSALLIGDPAAARWSPLDRFQYFEGWGSGYGYPQAAYFLEKSADAPGMIYALDGHSAYQLRTYLPSSWSSRVATIAYGPDGGVLRTEQARIDRLFSQSPVWLVVSPQLLQQYLAANFGAGTGELRLRELTSFDKPGARAQLAIYDVARRKTDF
ncbi:MAG TPA: glycosyltransferase family 39 protein [Steroidobacteraceae bacterium]|nr:glycosyltransferase family 39 protein [Steroidobacteraceae bacterium]